MKKVLTFPRVNCFSGDSVVVYFSSIGNEYDGYTVVEIHVPEIHTYIARFMKQLLVSVYYGTNTQYFLQDQPI